MHDLDPVGVGVVVPDELAGLVGGVGDEPVGGLDDLGLADLATARLEGVALGAVQVLDARHGVHRVDQRHVPAVGGEPADLPGEPVVRVDEVVVPLGRLGGDPHHAGGEGAQLARQVLLVEALVGAGGDVAHEDPGSTSTTGASEALVRRVKMSTATPRRASRLADSRT